MISVEAVICTTKLLIYVISSPNGLKKQYLVQKYSKHFFFKVTNLVRRFPGTEIPFSAFVPCYHEIYNVTYLMRLSQHSVCLSHILTEDAHITSDTCKSVRGNVAK